MIGHVGGGAFRARTMTQLQDILSHASPKGVIYDQGLRYAMLVAKPSDAPRLAEFVRRYEGGFASGFQMDIDKLMAEFQESRKQPSAPGKD